MIITDLRALEAIERIARETGIPAKAIVGPVRTRSLCLARGQVMAVLWKEHGMSLTEVGTALGRNHTAVLVAVRRALGPEVYKCELAKRGRKVA